MLNPSSTQVHPPAPTRQAILAWLGLAAGGAALVALGSAHGTKAEKQTLRATTTIAGDTDGDGLSDLQEFSFGTSPYLYDTDGDGYGDGHELALGKSPVVVTDSPAGDEPLGIGMVAHGGLHSTVIEMQIFALDGEINTKLLALSMLTSQGFTALNNNRVFALATVRDIPVIGGGILRSISVPMSPLMVQANGVVHWVAALGESGASAFGAAATIRLEGDLADNSVSWTRAGHTLPPTSGGQLPPGGARIDQPIPPTNGEPVGNPPGTPGQVCVQVTEVVGTGVGSTIITEVIAATCEMGWAAFCSAGPCSASVGATFETVNPRNLLGG